ncbi:protein OS-9 homolog isoform X2 [Actinidia eriantha]|nr:protein OS-9 homolog isoform X2 [Actinidia eriantha]
MQKPSREVGKSFSASRTTGSGLLLSQLGFFQFMVKKALGKMRLGWLWDVLFAINLFSHEVSADHIFPPHAGGTFSRSSRDPKCKIEFHLEDSPFHPSTAAYNQNLADVSTLKDPRSKDASQRYHAHQYTNGTMCDLTNRPQETEVRFVCSESRTMISSITELSTCKYALTVQCPMLCKHP